jgi:epoxide hydrolase-like predicted phosphatase
MIEAVLFDFGGVFTGSPFDTIRDGGARFGIDPDELFSIVFGPYDRDTDHPWHRLERGEVPLFEARDLLIELARERGHDIDPFDVLKHTVIGGEASELLVERTIELRREGYRTALITNNIAEFSDGWRRLVPVDEMFEVVIDSCEVGMRKPDARVFRLALERLGGIAPERSVFLDDAPGNIAAARALGIHTVHVGPDRAAAVLALDTILADAREGAA